MKIELRSIDSVRPYSRALRVNDRAVGPVAASIKEFGFLQPIVVDEKGMIIVGQVRWLAAKKLECKKVPVIVARDLTPAQIKSYRIADNKLHEIADWNFPELSIELASLQKGGADLSLLSFSPHELAALLERAIAPVDVDEIPEPPDEAITRPGDLWILGNHRLLCGDSSKADDVGRVVGNAKIHLFNSDPPYNVNVEPRSHNALMAAGKKTHHQELDRARKPRLKATTGKLRAKDRPLKNDFLPPAEFERMLFAWFKNAADVMIPGGSFYVWGGYANCANYPPALMAAGLYFSQAVIWIKEAPVLTRKDFMGNHEWSFYGWKEGAAHRFFGPRNVPDTWLVAPGKRDAGRSIGRGLAIESATGSRIQVCPPAASELPVVKVDEKGVLLFGQNEATDVWSVKKLSNQKTVHLTEKPVELAARAMRFSSQRGENVLDLFGGSGSTLIAAEQNDRRARLLELDPLYCDVIVNRWEKLSGKKAKRERAK
jgi:DNA modification methylase